MIPALIMKLIKNKMKFKLENKYRNQIVGCLVLSLLLIGAGFYLSYPRILIVANSDQSNSAKNQDYQAQKDTKRMMAFENLDLEAKAFVVYDIETDKIIAGKQAEKILPLASITKVMTVLIAEEILNRQETIVVERVINDNGHGLYYNEHWRLSGLVALALVGSSNNSALALAEAKTNLTEFVSLMNKKAIALGLADLYFTNPTGLDDDFELGGRGSALSVAKLFGYIIKTKPNLLAVTTQTIVREKSLDGFDHLATNTNEIVRQIPGLLASKTGYTIAAGGNLATVANLGLSRPVAIVVLGSSPKGRFTDTQKLISAALDYYSNL